MDERKDFIKILQETIQKLQEAGIITDEQLKEGIEVPIEWFYSSGIDRRILSKTFENICKKVNTDYQKSINKNYAIHTISLKAYNGKSRLQIVGKDNWTKFDISDESFHQQGKIQTFNGNEFIQEMIETIKKDKYGKIRETYKQLSHDDIQNIIDLMYDKTEQENLTKGMAESLSEMVQNFGEYYQYIQNEKKEVEKGEIKVTAGGLIEQDVDKLSYTRTGLHEGNTKTERVSEIYPFEERDAIFRGLQPIEIIAFDSIDEEGKVQKGSYTSYVFENYRENGGYFLISEPYRGDKSCRAVYVSEEKKEQLQEGEENPNFWVDTARAYLEMSCLEFQNEVSTYTFKHRNIQPYAAKMQYIISGKTDPNISKGVLYSSKMALSKLFGVQIDKKQLEAIISDVMKSDILSIQDILTSPRKEHEVGGEEK